MLVQLYTWLDQLFWRYSVFWYGYIRLWLIPTFLIGIFFFYYFNIQLLRLDEFTPKTALAVTEAENGLQVLDKMLYQKFYHRLAYLAQ
jgi:hypothetical protein